MTERFRCPRGARSLGLAVALCVVWGPMACGGSSSETPWPVEPDGVNLSPEDEHKDRQRPMVLPEPKKASAASEESGASEASEGSAP